MVFAVTVFAGSCTVTVFAGSVKTRRVRHHVAWCCHYCRLSRSSWHR
jgi:hypothetical protein